MKYYIWALGCQMNTSDAERIASTLKSIGYKAATCEKDADLIVVVSCSVRQSAIDRIHGKIRNWNQRKKKEPLITVLTGCILDQDRIAFEKVFDFVFDIKNLDQLPAIIQGKTDLSDKELKDYFKINPNYSSPFQAFIPIMTGCNNFCSYCAVPYTRGREKSRPHLQIIDEIKNLITLGYKEITLLGQNVNSYGKDNNNEISFPKLIEEINRLEGDFWLRFVTSHPKDLSDELINLFAQKNKLTDYLHLPLQAGNNEILKKMNRKYTVEHYKELVKKVITINPSIALSTDIIVGFPGETTEQFEDTKKAMQEIKYDMAYIAQYSPRSGTAAAKFLDDISKDEKKKREAQLTQILKETALEKNKKYLGKKVKILVESKKKDLYFGRTSSYKLVAIKSNKNLIGQFVDLKITGFNAWALEAEYLEIQ
jgi:tRNA-2-methylthio-N6-dimethylallyladenosine synthase